MGTKARLGMLCQGCCEAGGMWCCATRMVTLCPNCPQDTGLETLCLSCARDLLL